VASTASNEAALPRIEEERPLLKNARQHPGSRIAAAVVVCAATVMSMFCVSGASAAAPTIVGSVSVSSVGSAGATLSVQINPGEEQTSCTFEYAISEGGENYTVLPSAEIDGAGAVNVTGSLEGLAPETAYQVRITATNTSGTVQSPATTFSTYPASIAGLPDHRGYEMVTPPSNGDSEVYEPTAMIESVAINSGKGFGDNTERPFQASADGNAVAYVTTPVPTSAGGNGSTGLKNGNQALARRSATGKWVTEDVQPAGLENVVYDAFSVDLSIGILDSIEPLATSAPSRGYDVLYTHTMDGKEYSPFFTVTPPDRHSGEFQSFGTEQIGEGPAHGPDYAGASANMSHLLFQANDALTAEALDGGAEQNNLYDSVGGSLRLVNVLPDGRTEPDATFGGLEYGAGTFHEMPDFDHVISADGSRIFWTDRRTNTLYVRIDDTRTIEVDASQGPGASGGGRFWAATSDGSRVFFTDESQLTAESTAAPGAPDLYTYDVESGDLVDLSVDEHSGEYADVQGVVGVSEDGSYVYFVAGGALASGASHRTCSGGGDCNLYVLHEGEPARFVATLAYQDETHILNSFDFGDWNPGLGLRTASLSRDGSRLTFMSTRNLKPGYDSKGLLEIYTYDAETGGNGEILCVSCKPTGVPPLHNTFPAVSWSATYAKRVMSSDGDRIFFESMEALVPQDTNGQRDVYEWERDGSGGCRREAGCLYLLSGGASSAPSFFLDASESGDDVFMVTRAQLVAADQNEVFDVYDARVGAPAPVAAPACTGTGCQGVPGTPPIFATPSSVTFSGAGNFEAPARHIVKQTKKKAHKKRPKRRKKARRADRLHRGRSVHGAGGTIRLRGRKAVK